MTHNYSSVQRMSNEAQVGNVDEESGLQLQPVGGKGLNWGGANRQGGAARWIIQGNKSQGSITIVRPDGKTERVQYQVTGEEGVILFNGIKFAYAGAPECQ
jgi:hypothetical protein